MQLVDIGANLTHESFSHDYEQVIDESKAANVAHIILTGTDLDSSTKALALAKSSSSFHSSTVGYHPHVASQFDEAALQSLTELAKNVEVVAIGETGLDYNRDFSPRAEQKIAFEQHLQLAAECQKPLFLHQREAHDDFFELLSRYRDRISGGVVHCFTDNQAALEAYLELDMYIGITGWVCDERRGLELQQLVPLIPANRLLIETDAPYLLPRNASPKPKTRRNEPKYLADVVKKVAECCQLPVNEIAKATTTNAKELFNLSF